MYMYGYLGGKDRKDSDYSVSSIRTQVSRLLTVNIFENYLFI